MNRDGGVDRSAGSRVNGAVRGSAPALRSVQLIGSTEAAGIWTIQAGIFPENTVSLALHARAVFRVVGRRKRLGRSTGGGAT